MSSHVGSAWAARFQQRSLPLARRPLCSRLLAPAGSGGLRPLSDVPRAGQEQQRKAKASSRGSPLPKVAGLGALGAGVLYAASSEVQDGVNEVAANLGEVFEDFNDASRDFFESIGDRLVSKPKEPWLLDFATMKYPEHLPTLVLDLDKVILHLDHDSRTGWHVIKRPYADQFFKEMQHYYEIVIFSDDVFPVALDISTKWELPVTSVLHRDFCKRKRNHYVKDLSKLGRKMDKVLMIDHDAAAFQWQPKNGILIKPFTGDPSDTELADLLDVLKAAATAPGDIRQFVEKFGGGDEDLGRRYLVHKQELDARSQKRRGLGQKIGGRGANLSAAAGGSFGGFPR